MEKQLEDAGQVPLNQVNTWSKVQIVVIAEITLSLLDGLFSIADTIEDRILPQPRTEEDILDGVKRLEDLTRPDDQSQYKNVEDGVMRALIDLHVMEEDVTFSELQTMLWLEQARLLNSNIVLLMDGFIGQRVAGSDLLDNIQHNLKVYIYKLILFKLLLISTLLFTGQCDVVKMWEKMDRYNDLISNGSMAVNHLSRLGQMSAL